MEIFHNDWAEFLNPELKKPYYLELRKFLVDEYKTRQIFPDMYDIFNALHYTSYHDTKVVILGQDPYHGDGQAHGLSFSVKPGVKAPPSLVNIYKEAHDDVGIDIPNHGDLTAWAKQGVLLLNTVLTVQEGYANSHKGKGWEIFTDHIIEEMNKREKPVVFILWGRQAENKASMIDTNKHCVITSAHPSPLSAHRGFFGSKPFSRTNEFLVSQGIEPIDWRID